MGNGLTEHEIRFALAAVLETVRAWDDADKSGMFIPTYGKIDAQIDVLREALRPLRDDPG